MGKVLGILLTGLNITDNNTDLEGVIHRDTLIRELNALETNDSGCIRFKCSKRRDPNPRYTHMGPVVTKARHYDPTPKNTPTVPDNFEEVEKW